MAGQGLRTLAIAYKHTSEGADFISKDENGIFEIEKNGLVLLAILGVRDPPRPEVKKAIEDCKAAHIKVRMVTGDNLVTAKAIATEIGILEPDDTHEYSVMEGPIFVREVGGLVCKKC